MGTAHRSSTADAVTGLQYMTLLLDATSFVGQFRRDNIDIGGTPAYDGTWDWSGSQGEPLWLGGGSTAADYIDGALGEFALYSRKLDDTELEKIHDYFRWIYEPIFLFNSGYAFTVQSANINLNEAPLLARFLRQASYAGVGVALIVLIGEVYSRWDSAVGSVRYGGTWDSAVTPIADAAEWQIVVIG